MMDNNDSVGFEIPQALSGLVESAKAALGNMPQQPEGNQFNFQALQDSFMSALGGLMTDAKKATKETTTLPEVVPEVVAHVEEPKVNNGMDAASLNEALKLLNGLINGASPAAAAPQAGLESTSQVTQEKAEDAVKKGINIWNTVSGLVGGPEGVVNILTSLINSQGGNNSLGIPSLQNFFSSFTSPKKQVSQPQSTPVQNPSTQSSGSNNLFSGLLGQLLPLKVTVPQQHLQTPNEPHSEPNEIVQSHNHDGNHSAHSHHQSEEDTNTVSSIQQEQTIRQMTPASVAAVRPPTRMNLIARPVIGSSASNVQLTSAQRRDSYKICRVCGKPIYSAEN
jgi:hypothetical protein